MRSGILQYQYVIRLDLERGIVDAPWPDLSRGFSGAGPSQVAGAVASTWAHGIARIHEAVASWPESALVIEDAVPVGLEGTPLAPPLPQINYTVLGDRQYWWVPAEDASAESIYQTFLAARTWLTFSAVTDWRPSQQSPLEHLHGQLARAASCSRLLALDALDGDSLMLVYIGAHPVTLASAHNNGIQTDNASRCR